MRHRVLSVAMAGVLSLSSMARAQGDATMGRVRGVAFDSVRGKPLADAFVVIVGVGRNTTSDSRGRFQFDSVPNGSYVLTVQHAALDSMGFYGLSVRVSVAGASDDVRIGSPSFATLWRAACGAGRVPDDSGFVYGAVRDAVTNRPVANAQIAVAWYDSTSRLDPRGADLQAKERDAFRATQRKLKPKSDIEQIPMPSNVGGSDYVVNRVDWNMRGRSDESGTYAVCGVPVRGYGVRVFASTDSASSDSIDIHMDPRVHRRDLRLGPPAGDSAGRGTVTGTLMDNAGAPFPYARVFVAGAPEARSDERGHFVLRDVPAGTRRVEVRYIGMSPSHTKVDVVAGDTATVLILFNRIPMLPGMTARATAGLGRVYAAEFDVRRKTALGYVVDSTVISRYPSVAAVLRDVPSLSVELRGAALSATVSDGRGGRCTPVVWMDGHEAAYGHMSDLTPREVAAIEVYARALTVPSGFMEKGSDRKCGAILVWTKYGFQNR